MRVWRNRNDANGDNQRERERNDREGERRGEKGREVSRFGERRKEREGERERELSRFGERSLTFSANSFFSFSFLKKRHLS